MRRITTYTVILIAFAGLFSCGLGNYSNEDTYEVVEEEQFNYPPPQNNDEEIKEILRLTRMISEVEDNVNEIVSDYQVAKALEVEGEIQDQSNDAELLGNIDAIKQRIANDQQQIAALRNQLKQYNSSNKDINKIKREYISQLEKKDEMINNLSGELDMMRTKIQEKEAIIDEQKNKISRQENKIESQKELINDLNKKNIIIYSKKMTQMYELVGDIVKLDYPERKIEVISDHPAGSYSLLKNNQGNAVINIGNPADFWGGNNFLIIRVNKRNL
jgi:chromosome segregation ATPase